MLVIAGETAGPNGLNFFEVTLEYLGVNIDYNFFQNKKKMLTGYNIKINLIKKQVLQMLNKSTATTLKKKIMIKIVFQVLH